MIMKIMKMSQWSFLDNTTASEFGLFQSDQFADSDELMIEVKN